MAKKEMSKKEFIAQIDELRRQIEGIKKEKANIKVKPTTIKDALKLWDTYKGDKLIAISGFIDKENPLFIDNALLKQWSTQLNIQYKGKKITPYISYMRRLQRIQKIAQHRKEDLSSYKDKILTELKDRIKTVKSLDITEPQKEHRQNNLRECSKYVKKNF